MPARMRVDLAAGGCPRTSTGLVKPRVSAIAVGVREPPLAPRMSAIAPGGPDPRRRRRPPGNVEVDQSSSGHTYALHVRGEMVARLGWRTGPGGAAGWYLCQRRGGWRRLAVDPALDARRRPHRAASRMPAGRRSHGVAEHRARARRGRDPPAPPAPNTAAPAARPGAMKCMPLGSRSTSCRSPSPRRSRLAPATSRCSPDTSMIAD